MTTNTVRMSAHEVATVRMYFAVYPECGVTYTELMDEVRDGAFIPHGTPNASDPHTARGYALVLNSRMGEYVGHGAELAEDMEDTRLYLYGYFRAK